MKSYTNAGDPPSKGLLDIIEFILMNEYGLKLDKNRKSKMKKNMNISIEEALYKYFNFSTQSIDIEEICERMYRRYQCQKTDVNKNAIIKCLDKDPLLLSYTNAVTGHKEWVKKSYPSQYSV